MPEVSFLFTLNWLWQMMYQVHHREILFSISLNLGFRCQDFKYRIVPNDSLINHR